MISITAKLEKYLLTSIKSVAKSLDIEFDEQSVSPLLELPNEEGHGDLATASAMRLAKVFRKSPREISQLIVDEINKNDRLKNLVNKIEIAGPGFINFFLTSSSIVSILRSILRQKQDYFKNELCKDENIMIEFVSANPTGPLNAVNARAAAVGDILANILKKSSANVHREFYVNDCGNQVNLLGESLKSRYYEFLNIETAFPENGYHGDYLKDTAKDLIVKFGNSLVDKDTGFFADYAIENNVTKQKTDLHNYGVEFDKWFSEKDIHQNDLINKSFNALKSKNFLYQKEGKWWFKSQQFGDLDDRVVIRDNGIPTYFLADTAYHKTKYDRDFNRLIDIWGPDHHGYIPRLSGALQALGFPKESFKVLIVQQVNLIKDGVPVKMSKRAGNIILMEDLIKEVGKDAARFFFVMRTSDSQLDFDLDLATKQTADNPCFYVQYAHARIHSIYKKYKEQGGDINTLNFDNIDINLLEDKEELEIIKKMGQFPQTIELCARNLDVHHLPYYLYELSSLFHSYYNSGKKKLELRIVTDNETKTAARLALITGLLSILKEGLKILGVSAPKKM